MYQPLIVIGAPRSGTNMLRDVLCKLPGVATWPCDEINYIWRHGNIRVNSDQFGLECARPEVVAYIRRKFDSFASTSRATWVVEKTCANSLRVPFVDKVIPDARYIFIVRDGLDAIGSAKLRWTAKLDIPYLLEKVYFVPLSDLPYYGLRYTWNRFYRLFTREKRLAFWGPQLNDMQGLVKTHSLEEVCAIQWRECVEMADQFLSTLPNDRVYRVRYENFVCEPNKELNRLASFFGLGADAATINAAVVGVSAGSVGKGRAALSDEVRQAVMPHIIDSLKKFDYECG